MNSADKCRANGWTVGTRLVGDEGYGPTTIEITAVGERRILAKELSPRAYGEMMWTLDRRDWQQSRD